uniref:Protein suppressor of underreplication n=1 Tax=Ceratitis capitata TaxID=7213 RepID=W8AG75_CERCA
MYHFVATCAPEPLELSEKVQIPGHIRQYLRDFQLETVRFLHNHLENRDFCILNDESGLGKCVSTAVYLGAIAKNKRCLIVVQNDDELVTGWQFHFDVLTNLSVGVLGPNTSSLEALPNIIIAKWATLRATVDGSKFNFDYVVLDNRGQMMSNNFCMSMLMSNYEHKANLLISSIDVTSDLKLLHNSLRLGGRLEHQYEQYKVFEAKYKLPNSKDVLNKIADLEQYFLKREMISDFCKDFRLRRYRHQFEEQLPFVDAERYKISLDLWRTISSSNSSQKSNDNGNNLNANSETATEELFNQALALNSEISQILDARRSQVPNSEHNEASEDAVIMSPLLIDSESCSSDEPEEVANITNHKSTTITQNKQKESDIYEFVDLSTEQCSEEYVNNGTKQKEKTTIKYQARSLAQDNDNKKTNEIEYPQKSVTTINFTEKPISGEKTKLLKNTKILKTNERELNNKEDNNKSLKGYTNTSIDTNENIAVSKPQIKNGNDKKQADVSSKSKPQANADTPVTATKRRTIKPPEKKNPHANTNKVKINNKEKQKPVAAPKHSSPEQPQQDRKDTKKLTDKESHENSKSLSPAKEFSVAKNTENWKKASSSNKEEDNDTSSKRHTPKEQTQLKGKEKQKLSDKESNNNSDNSISTTYPQDTNAKLTQKNDEVKRKVGRPTKVETKPKQGETNEVSPRRMRQLRSDKKDMGKKKSLVSPKEKAPSETASPKTPAKSSIAIENKSSKDSADKDVEKTKRTERTSNTTRVEVPLTPTVRNTRSMQRVTRSSDSTRSKYMKSPRLLDLSKQIRKKIVKQTDIKDSKGGTKTMEFDDNEALVTDTSSNGKKIVKRKSLHQSNDGKKKAQITETKRQKAISASKDTENSRDSAILPCSDNTEGMQCGQKISGSTPSDNGFLRPPTPDRSTRNSEPKNFLTTPSSFTDSEVVFVPPIDAANKSQAILILSSSTDDGSLSSQKSEQSRRTRALKQKKALKRPATDPNALDDPPTTPSFGELLAKQRIQRKSPDLFSASTDLGLTCTQQLAADRHDGVETFQGFKIFGSEVKQIQQQHAITTSGRKSAPALSRGRSCLNLLEKMFEPTPTDVRAKKSQATQHTKSSNTQKSTKKVPDDKLVKRATRGSQPVVPSLPNTVNVTQTQGTDKQKQGNKNSTNPMINGTLIDEEIFEITNNDAFGSMMRINSNGEISPVQLTTRNQQPTQHNKITNYLIGSTQLTPTEAVLDERTPSKRTPTQPQSGTATRRSPKSRSTQTTKLTKWFQKNGTINELAASSEYERSDIRMKQLTRSRMAKRLKRRCLELSFKN